MNIGDKIVSDDYSTIGVLIKIDNKLMVISESDLIEYDDYDDWELYESWKSKQTQNKNFWNRIFN